eukprot:123919-Pelagomonas_calceolata.AAC.5
MLLYLPFIAQHSNVLKLQGLAPWAMLRHFCSGTSKGHKGLAYSLRLWLISCWKAWILGSVLVLKLAKKGIKLALSLDAMVPPTGYRLQEKIRPPGKTFDC